MDKDTVSYIINYFSELMTEVDKLAIKSHGHLLKTEDNPKMRKILIDKGWISESEDVKTLLKDGYEVFELKVAERIMNEFPEKVFLNNCPQCKKLARTPKAKQCRHCGHQWRKLDGQSLLL